MNSDKIREALKALAYTSMHSRTEYKLSDRAIDGIMTIITPYLRHGITEEEAKDIELTMRLHEMPVVNSAHSLGLIVEPEQRENIAG